MNENETEESNYESNLDNLEYYHSEESTQIEEDLEGYPPELVEAARQMGLNA